MTTSNVDEKEPQVSHLPSSPPHPDVSKAGPEDPVEMVKEIADEAACDTLEIEPSAAGKSNEFQDEVFPIDENKPLFDVVLSKTNIKPLCRLEFPQEIWPLLPSAKLPALLTCNGKTWETTVIGDVQRKKFKNDTWKKFITDNNLKFKDCLVFQIMENRADQIKFSVQILRDEFPSELKDVVPANTLNID